MPHAFLWELCTVVVCGKASAILRSTCQSFLLDCLFVPYRTPYVKSTLPAPYFSAQAATFATTSRPMFWAISSFRQRGPLLSVTAQNSSPPTFLPSRRDSTLCIPLGTISQP